MGERPGAEAPGHPTGFEAGLRTYLRMVIAFASVPSTDWIFT
jgi:hypothetical protein